MRRILTAALAAGAMLAVYVGLIYGFFAYVWPVLPNWMRMIGFIALAVFAIGSPIYLLVRMSRNTPVPEHLLNRRPPDDPPP